MEARPSLQATRRLWLQLAAVVLPIALFAAGGFAIVQYQAAKATHLPVSFSFTQSPAPNANGWNNSPVTLNVCATSESDVARITSAHILQQDQDTPFEGFPPSDTDCTDFQYDQDVDSTDYFYASVYYLDGTDVDVTCCSPSSDYLLRIDMTAPWAGITSGPNISAIPDDTPSFDFTGSDVFACEPGNSDLGCFIQPVSDNGYVASGSDYFLCAVDPSPVDDPSEYEECTSPYTSDPLSDGEHTFCVMVVDLAGNYSDPDCTEFEVDAAGDNTPPTLVITYAQYGTFGTTDTAAAQPPAASNYTPGTWSKKKVAVFISCVDELGGSGIAVNTYPTRINYTSEGSHAFNPPGVCVDGAGNVAVEPVGLTIMVDTVAPVCSVVQPVAANKNGTPKLITLTINAQDPTSGVATNNVTAITKEGLGSGGSVAGAIPRPSGSVWTFIGANGVKWKVNGVVTDNAGHSTNCTLKYVFSQ